MLDATPPTVVPRYSATDRKAITSWQITFTYTSKGRRKRVRCKLPGVDPDSSPAELEAAAAAFWRESLERAADEQAAWRLSERGYDIPKVGAMASFPIEQVVDLWLDSLKAKAAVQPDTVGTLKSRQVSRGQLPPWFCQILVCDLTSADLEQLQNELLLSYKVSTVRSTMGALSVALGWARKKHRALSHNPFESFELVRMPAPEVDHYTVQQREAIIKAAYEPFKSLFELGFFTGLRPGELRGVWCDDLVEARDGSIWLNIRRTRVSKDRGYYGPPKGRRARLVPLGSRARRAVERALCFLRQPGDRSLFPSPRQLNGYDPSALRDAWRKVAQKAGVPVFSAKSMRHTYACLLLEQGADLYSVSQILGHQSVKTTERYYASPQPGRLLEMTRLLDTEQAMEEKVRGTTRERGAVIVL